MKRTKDQIKAVIGASIGTAMALAPKAKQLIDVPNALGVSRMSSISYVGGYASARAAVPLGLSAVAGAAAVGATAITKAQRDAEVGEARENAERDISAVGIGNRISKNTGRRIRRATGELRLGVGYR